MPSGNRKFENKQVLVTGGASGIGLAIVRRFAAEGAEVFLVDRDEKRWVSAKDNLQDKAENVEFMSCDISDSTAIKNCMEHIPVSLDVLVNNAGVSHVGNLGETTEYDFDRLYRTNVKGLYNCTNACLPKLIENGGGSIINMASVAAVVGLPDRFAYSMTKGAVLAMTRSIARDYLKYGIRCNAISPARVHTPFVDDFIKANYPGREKEMFEELAASQPVGRMGRPEEIASMAIYLSSDEAAFITGANFPVDGGLTGLQI